MGKNTIYNPPSGSKIVISMEDVLRRSRRESFWRHRVPMWQAALFIALVAGVLFFTFWVDHWVLTCENYQMFCN